MNARKRMSAAIGWVEKRANVVQGWYLKHDGGDELEPRRDYCLDHARSMAFRLWRRSGKAFLCCSSGSGADSISWCGIRTCGVALDYGGLTDYGVRSTLGLEEEHPLAFVADIDELLLVSRALTSGGELWDLWLSQVIRRRYKVTKTQQHAFEAAWLVGERRLALDILARPRNRRHA